MEYSGLRDVSIGIPLLKISHFLLLPLSLNTIETITVWVKTHLVETNIACCGIISAWNTKCHIRHSCTLFRVPTHFLFLIHLYFQVLCTPLPIYNIP